MAKNPVGRPRIIKGRKRSINLRVGTLDEITILLREESRAAGSDESVMARRALLSGLKRIRWERENRATAGPSPDQM
jgi:hypothetical protein